MPCGCYRTFETISAYCDQFSAMIPVGFVLGFFVTMVVGRWWDEFQTIPWPQNVAMLVTANLQVPPVALTTACAICAIGRSRYRLRICYTMKHVEEDVYDKTWQYVQITFAIRRGGPSHSRKGRAITLSPVPIPPRPVLSPPFFIPPLPIPYPPSRSLPSPLISSVPAPCSCLLFHPFAYTVLSSCPFLPCCKAAT